MSSSIIPSPTATPPPTPTGDDFLTAECATAVPGKNGHVPLGSCNAYYNFDPQFEPAVAVAAIFGALTLLHITLAIVYKKGYTWVLIMGSFWETAAFAVHAAGALDQQQIAYATVHSLLFLLAPLWINAFAYMTFGRIVYYFVPDRRIVVKATSMSKYFVWADVLTFIVQGVGGVLANPGASVDIIKIGLKIYLVGLGFQQGFILLFVVLMVVFHRRRLQLDAEEQHETGAGFHPPQGRGARRSWKPLLFAMYAALLLISMRIIYRIAEFAGGITPSNPIPFHEEYSYALDAAPMMLCILILGIFHPGRTLRGPDAEFPSRKERKAEKRAIKAEKKAVKEGKKAMEMGSRGSSMSHVEMIVYEGRQGGNSGFI